MSKMRYTFVRDESSHWYLIPMSKLARFNELLELGEDAGEELDEEFEKYMSGRGFSYSFTDPKELK